MKERAEQRRQTEEDYGSEEGGRKQSLRAKKSSAEEWEHVENDLENSEEEDMPFEENKGDKEEFEMVEPQ